MIITGKKLSALSAMVFACWVGILAMLCAPASANQFVKLHNYLLPDRLVENGKAGYNRFLDILLSDLPFDVEMNYAPLARNSLQWVEGGQGCIFPASENALSTTPAVVKYRPPMVSSEPIDNVSVYIFTRPNQKRIHSRQELVGKQVGHMIGSVASRLLRNDDIELIAIGSDRQLIRMLEKNRLDAVMGFHPDLPIALVRLGPMALSFDPSLVIYRSATHFVCYDTPDMRRFLKVINPKIREMRRDGRAAFALGRHADIVPIRSDSGS